MSTARQLSVGTAWRGSTLPPLPVLEGTKIDCHTVPTDRLPGWNQCARGQKLLQQSSSLLSSQHPQEQNPPLWPRDLMAPCLRPSLSTWCPPIPGKEVSYDSSPFSSLLFSSPAAQEACDVGAAFVEVDRVEAGQCLGAEQGTCSSGPGMVQRRSIPQWVQEERQIHCARPPRSYP